MTPGRNTFIFMQFYANILLNNKLVYPFVVGAFLLETLDPSLETVEMVLSSDRHHLFKFMHKSVRQTIKFHCLPTLGSFASSRYEPYALGMLNLSARRCASSSFLAPTATTWIM